MPKFLTLGKAAGQAADGADTEYAFSEYKPGVDWRFGSQIAGGTAAATFLIAWASSAVLAAANSGLCAFYLDPADFANSRTVKLRLQGSLMANAVVPAVNFTFNLYPVATWGGASGATPTVATVGASVASCAVNAPAAGGPSPVASSADFTCPAAGWYVLAVVTSGTTAANSNCFPFVRLQRRAV